MSRKFQTKFEHISVQCCISYKNQSFDLLPQIKCPVSIWNATLGWNELSNLLLDNKGSVQFFLGGALKFFQKQIHECLLETLKLLCTDKNQYKNH